MKSSETSREGFVLPAVIFTMAILGLLGVAALATANDEHRASRAMRESGAALYAAKAGAHMILGTVVDSPWTVIDTLAGAAMASGDSVDLGWSTLPSGASYHGVLYRYDNGGSGKKRMYDLTVVGRGAGPWGGERLIRVSLYADPPVSIAMDGAFQFGGNASIGNGGGFNGGPGVTIDGNDNVPPGWEGRCDPPGAAMPGLVVPDITAVTMADSPNIMGDPAIVEAPFDTLAFDATFAALVAQATIVFPPGVSLGNSDIIGPVENPLGVCDTSSPLNWGAPEDPTHPCFDYFPIVYVPDGWDFKTQPDGAGQGIILSDVPAQFENGFSWYGLVMARDGIQVEQGKSGCEPSNIYGSMYTRNSGSNIKLWGPKWFPGDITCNGTEPGSSLFYSSCAMARIEAALTDPGGQLLAISSRAWTEVLR